MAETLRNLEALLNEIRISGMWEAPQVPNPKIRGCFVAVRHLRCLPHSGVLAILTVPARPYVNS